METLTIPAPLRLLGIRAAVAVPLTLAISAAMRRAAALSTASNG